MFNDVIVNYASSMKELEVFFDTEMKCSNHVRDKLSKFNKVYHMLKIKTPFLAPMPVKLRLCKSCSLTTMLYYSAIWSPNRLESCKLDVFNKRCFNEFFGKAIQSCLIVS